MSETETWGKKDYMAGDKVLKTGGDYKFQGFVVSVFWRKNGQIRYVVENDDGICQIFTKAQLVRIEP